MKNIFIKEKTYTEHNYRTGKDEVRTIKQPNTPVIVGTVIAGFVCLMLVLGCFASVPTGHTGVVTTFGRVENYVLDSGIHLKAPWQSVIKMDNRVQKQTVDMSCFSSDIQEVSMVYTVNYQISKSDAMTIYSTIGKNFYDTVIVPNVTESVKVAAAHYTAENLVNMRSELAQLIEDDLADRLLAYNIELVSTSIEDMDFTDAFTNAVEAKQVAAQNKL
jgi:regulator of protease activity HflC (stomatin/prohibitin superfamily)